MDPEDLPPLLNLPAELIHHIFTFLTPLELVDVSRTCRLLRDHSSSDQLWYPLVQRNIPGVTLKTPGEFSSFRELYTTFHSFWFLSRNRLWFANHAHTGKLIICRFDPRFGSIEGYALVAERGAHTFELWHHNHDVIIHTFQPKVQLDLNAPLLKIDAAALRAAQGGDKNCLQKEIAMEIHSSSTAAAGLFSRFMLTRPWPTSLQSPGTSLWPPQCLPAVERCQNASSTGYTSIGHKPSKLSEVSEGTFRIRKWMEFSARNQGINMRVGEEVTTWATLPREAYTPTESKPWRGIFVGDYAGHGCEFLAVLQPDEPLPLPEHAERTLAEDRSRSVSSDGSWDSTQPEPSEGSPETPTSEEPSVGSSDKEKAESSSDTLGDNAARSQPATTKTSTQTAETEDEEKQKEAEEEGEKDDDDEDDEDEEEDNDQHEDEDDDAERSIYSGRLEAIKLTGDPNIPRGEYTFIAPEIGDEGLVRIAHEDIFKGARIVRSVGHIAARGFRDDEYIPSQLILISHDKIAQYWESFGHISFYRRVDIEKFVNV